MSRATKQQPQFDVGDYVVPQNVKRCRGVVVSIDDDGTLNVGGDDGDFYEVKPQDFPYIILLDE